MRGLVSYDDLDDGETDAGRNSHASAEEPGTVPEDEELVLGVLWLRGADCWDAAQVKSLFTSYGATRAKPLAVAGQFDIEFAQDTREEAASRAMRALKAVTHPLQAHEESRCWVDIGGVDRKGRPIRTYDPSLMMRTWRRVKDDLLLAVRLENYTGAALRRSAEVEVRVAVVRPTSPADFSMSRYEMAKTYGTGYTLLAKMGFADRKKGLLNPLEPEMRKPGEGLAEKPRGEKRPGGWLQAATKKVAQGAVAPEAKSEASSLPSSLRDFSDSSSISAESSLKSSLPVAEKPVAEKPVAEKPPVEPAEDSDGDDLNDLLLGKR
jgi:hypothetical protein